MIVALEVLDKGKVGRAYAQVIENASHKEFKPFLEAYVSHKAHIITDDGILAVDERLQYRTTPI